MQELTNQYVDEIVVFSAAHNIVGRNSAQDIHRFDVQDSETILDHTKEHKRILDIGSGAGLPGIIIAINQPWTKVVMSEKNKKKAYFIKKTIKNLGLKNAEVIDTTITKQTVDLGQFDVVTARALAPTNKIVEMSEQLLSSTGKFLLMKGKKEVILEEVEGLDKTKYSYNIHTKKLAQAPRHILEINKI
ncbi:16S rRNA (guanine(527)-N(7))-methyltransferase RsmG [Gammaproteobacteria bacterium]|nr:16S rRNA (guanine(527)-N(7))-methyltransferase RsmG [Gammaproteobacteria bacterium]